MPCKITYGIGCGDQKNPKLEAKKKIK